MLMCGIIILIRKYKTRDCNNAYILCVIIEEGMSNESMHSY